MQSRPAERRGIRRDQVPLLVIDREAEAVHHSRFDRLGEYLSPGDLLATGGVITGAGFVLA